MQLNRLASLAKWLSDCLWTKWLWVRWYEPPDFRGAGEFWCGVFSRGWALFWNFSGEGKGGYHLNGPSPLRGTLYFLVHKLYHEDLIIIFLYFNYEDWMKILYFPQKFLYFFFGPCFCATAQKFRLLECVILLHATILGIT